MPAPPSLPASLLRSAATDPESPWVFRPEGFDWRWHPFGEMAAWMALDAAMAAKLPGEGAAPHPFAATPAWLSLDLGLQLAGRISAPAGLAGDGCGAASNGALPEAAQDRPGEGFPEAGRNRALLTASGALDPRALPPRPGAPGSPYRHWRRVPLPEPPEAPGGAQVRGPEGQPLVWNAADLLAEGEELGAAIERLAGPPSGGREIVVWCGPPDDPAERSFLSWATLRGAALVLEPDPQSRIATTLWVRPTVLLGSPADLAALRHSLAAERPRAWFRRTPALPLRRLRAIVLSGPDPLPAAEEAFWRGRGVAILAAERRNRGI